ncbi:MAG TPA: hypothetical protein VK902_17225 [Rubrobacter sp.]|jgi:hypothetical protein|nr:hypothetical protein [Rubrobacter sp.]
MLEMRWPSLCGMLGDVSKGGLKWADYSAMPLERAVEYALSEEEPKPPTLAAVLEQQPHSTTIHSGDHP